MQIANGLFSSESPYKCPEAGIIHNSTLEQRYSIIRAYLQVLDGVKGPLAVDSALPYPKEQIGQAILDELVEDPECDLRRRLEIAYVLLESFIPLEEYRVIEDFKSASFRAQQIADMGDPVSILRSARIMRKAKGESAVRLQEKIHEKMTARQSRIIELGHSSAA
jgi:hypothetical protein